MRNLSILTPIIVAAALGSATSGCVGVAFGAAGVTGLAVAQERSTEQAVNDTDIKISVGSKLLNEGEERFSEVYIEVVEGRVLLTGEVPEAKDRVRAAEIVWTTPGVVELINEVEVGDDSGLRDFANDAWITTQLRARLLTDGHVDSINYTIETIDGTVYLIGVAQDEAELLRVAEIARNVKGVNRVVSHVLTKDDQRRVTG